MQDDEKKKISKQLSGLWDQVPSEEWPVLWSMMKRSKFEARERHKKPRKKLTTEAYYHIFVACSFIADWCPASKRKAPSIKQFFEKYIGRNNVFLVPIGSDWTAPEYSYPVAHKRTLSNLHGQAWKVIMKDPEAWNKWLDNYIEKVRFY